ncbi:alpha/beta hydrolase [Winogradskyella alexanderae]|uniref:Esterase n=1 Tax=Winogradskyella alexanderae TaxID=2877123 RepID=A0ABS7XT44_9FLAO|nr:esterase [Winogradskyella alexanderae]MCA0133197.1 esterase [Winogradskyella alexanderae]
MNSYEKEISYQANNSYSTLNTLSETTKNIWFVCHGMGYLSRYFLKYFKDLNPEENYIIAPQAPSKYYQQPKMHVGANWLTRDNTKSGMKNIINYFDAILDNEKLPSNHKLIVLGYSQGVSVALRYLAKRKIQCDTLIIHSGGIPKELNPEDYSYLNKNTNVLLVYGTMDEYLNDDRIKEETAKAKKLFHDKLHVKPFKGKHIVNIDLINAIG